MRDVGCLEEIDDGCHRVSGGERRGWCRCQEERNVGGKVLMGGQGRLAPWLLGRFVGAKAVYTMAVPTQC